MHTIQFAIIGCGRIAIRHALHIQAYGKLVAVCDRIETRAAALGGQYGVPYFLSLEETLASGINIDVVVICTPNGLHAPQAIQALHNGYHVLVEKPMAISSGDCAAMIKAAQVSGKQLFTVMQNRFNPPVLATKNALDANALGKISSVQLSCLWNRDNHYYHDSWKGSKKWDGGTLFTQFSHFIDLLYWFFGDVAHIEAVAKNTDHQGIIEFEDCGVVLLEFSSGIIGSIHFSVNSFARNREGSLTIAGDQGIVKIGGEYLNTIEYQAFSNYQPEPLPAGSEANDYGSYKGSMSNHDKVYQSLAATLQQGQPYYADSFEGLKTVEIIERIYQSARAKPQ